MSTCTQRCYGKFGHDPTAAHDWQALGREYLGLGEGERAVAAMQRALELEPQNPLLWWSMVRARGRPSELSVGPHVLCVEVWVGASASASVFVFVCVHGCRRLTGVAAGV